MQPAQQGRARLQRPSIYRMRDSPQHSSRRGMASAQPIWLWMCLRTGTIWNATVQRIRNKWNSKALFDHFEGLTTSPITVERNRTSWTCIFLDMTHIPDARMDDDADQALKHRLQEQQRANTKHVGTHPNILNELSMHTEFIEHCRVYPECCRGCHPLWCAGGQPFGCLQEQPT